jgi:hypothetical protein
MSLLDYTPHRDYDAERSSHECPSNGTDYHGRCLGECRECGEHLLSTGRYTVYCPSCDTCPTCGCPNADGFSHYLGCADTEGNPW